METVKFSQEYTFGSKTLNELNLDFDSLTGFDLLKLENEFKKRIPGFNIKEQEDAWYITVAAKVADVKYGDLLQLKARDFVKLTLVMKGFLMGTDTEEKRIDMKTEE